MQKTARIRVGIGKRSKKDGPWACQDSSQVTVNLCKNNCVSIAQAHCEQLSDHSSLGRGIFFFFLAHGDCWTHGLLCVVPFRGRFRQKCEMFQCSHWHARVTVPLPWLAEMLYVHCVGSHPSWYWPALSYTTTKCHFTPSSKEARVVRVGTLVCATKVSCSKSVKNLRRSYRRIPFLEGNV